MPVQDRCYTANPFGYSVCRKSM